MAHNIPHITENIFPNRKERFSWICGQPKKQKGPWTISGCFHSQPFKASSLAGHCLQCHSQDIKVPLKVPSESKNGNGFQETMLHIEIIAPFLCIFLRWVKMHDVYSGKERQWLTQWWPSHGEDYYVKKHLNFLSLAPGSQLESTQKLKGWAKAIWWMITIINFTFRITSQWAHFVATLSPEHLNKSLKTVAGDITTTILQYI